MTVDSAERLIRRANTSLDAFSTYLSGWIESSVAIVPFRDPDYGSGGWCLSCTGAADPEAMLTAGDAAFYARAALDHVAWDVFHRSGGDSGSATARGLYFPIRQTPPDFAATVAHDYPGAPAEVLAVFESAQDYATGGQSLRILNELSKTYRHRELSVAGVYSMAARFTVPDQPSGMSAGLEIAQNRKVAFGERPIVWVSWFREDGTLVPAIEAPPIPEMPRPHFEIGLIAESIVSLSDFSAAVQHAARTVASYAALFRVAMKEADA